MDKKPDVKAIFREVFGYEPELPPVREARALYEKARANNENGAAPKRKPSRRELRAFYARELEYYDKFVGMLRGE